MGAPQASPIHLRLTGAGRRLSTRTARERSERGTFHAKRRIHSAPRFTSEGTGNEWAVIQEAIAGNTAAQENLFSRYTSRLYKVAFAVLRNREDAEDALQDGLCKAFTGLQSFQGRSSIATWLTRIVVNAALMIRRKNNAHPEASLDEILEVQPERPPPGVVDARPNPEAAFSTTEVNTLVEVQVRRLPAKLQKAFHLRERQMCSTRESCKVLGITSSSLKSRIYRARRKLAQGLHRSLATCASA